jgi:hypothetical protein
MDMRKKGNQEKEYHSNLFIHFFCLITAQRCEEINQNTQKELRIHPHMLYISQALLLKSYSLFPSTKGSAM